MSPSTASQSSVNIKVKVPRHNTQRVGTKFASHIEAVAKTQSVRVQTYYPTNNALSQAIESASEWNSLLATARADRGPQWDVGTQMFHVDQGSELYYDPTPLLEVIRENDPRADQDRAQRERERERERAQAERSPRMTRSHSSQQPLTPQHHAPHHPGHLAHVPPHHAPHTPHTPHHPSQQPGGGFSNAPFSPVSAGHFYSDPSRGAMGNMGIGGVINMGGGPMGVSLNAGGGGGGMNMNMGMGMGGGPGPISMNMSPNMGGGMGGGGMSGMGMGSPDPRRGMMTRGPPGSADGGFISLN